MRFWSKYVDYGQKLATGQYPEGKRIVGYVRASGRRTTDPATVAAGAFFTSLTTALANCTSDIGDVIVVLNGHSESVGTAMFTSAPTGVTIVGQGCVDEDNAPTFLWSGATSNWAVAAKNTTIANVRLLADANDVTEAITVTAAGFKLLNCFVNAGVGSSTDIVSFLNFSTGASNGLVAGCDMRSTAGGNTSMIKGGTVVDDLKIVGNRIFGTSNSTTLGNIHISAAMTNLLIAGNFIDNQTASGTACISFTDVACTGIVADNMLGVLANTTVPAGGIILAATTNILMHFNQNYYSDGVKGTSAILGPTVTT